MKRLICLMLICLFGAGFLLLPVQKGQADLRTPISPGWWDPDGLAAGQDWHYRVPVTLPAASSINSTAKVNINFTSLMTELGINGTFDINSIRVVRPGGALATVQEYNDLIFNDATDAAANNRGEVKWIVQDGGAQTYYVYFDITQNGAKSVNPQTPINANFERSTTGQEDPTGWTGTKITGYDAQVRPNETVTVAGTSTNGSPNTGAFSYLIGARSAADGSGTNRATLSRTFTVPATNPGNLTVRWKPQGFDSSDNGSTNWDYLTVQVQTTQIIGPTAGNYNTRPFSPNKGTGAQSGTTSGYGPYNNWDLTSTGTHTNGMTVTAGATPWWTYNYSLSAFAGQTITVQFSANHASSYQTWYLIDDLEWSIVNGTLGAAQAFGVGITQPTGSFGLAPSDKLKIIAIMDAQPTSATATVLDNGGAVIASGIILYDNGTHGDATANDGIWTNDGLTPASPTYDFAGVTSGTNWTVRVDAKDGSTSTIGTGSNGLAHRVSLPNPIAEANYWNVDEQLFSFAITRITVSKISWVVNDYVSASNYKRIPGARVRYCITLSNSGTIAATSVNASDNVPATLSFDNTSIRSGGTCGTAATSEDINTIGGDETDPVGASASGSTLSFTAPSIAGGASVSFTYDVIVQ